MTNVFSPEEFWHFSAEVYARKSVKECCLLLQGDYGVDVNLLLLCHWLDGKKYTLERQTLMKLIGLSNDWQHGVLIPQRARRAALAKNSVAYSSALEMELTMEQNEQRALIDLLNLARTPTRKQSFSQNTNCLAYASEIPFPAKMLTALFSVSQQ